MVHPSQNTLDYNSFNIANQVLRDKNGMYLVVPVLRIPEP